MLQSKVVKEVVKEKLDYSFPKSTEKADNAVLLANYRKMADEAIAALGAPAPTEKLWTQEELDAVAGQNAEHNRRIAHNLKVLSAQAASGTKSS
jgi:hypothetical protein